MRTDDRSRQLGLRDLEAFGRDIVTLAIFALAALFIWGMVLPAVVAFIGSVIADYFYRRMSA